MKECQKIINNYILPEDFFKAEIRNHFTVSESRKKIWAIQIDLLLQLDKVCKKYNLKYFLMFGSLLGAIRHNGFIPWDDDLDVCMFRDDYEKLLKLSNEFSGQYFMQTPYTDKNYFYSFAKLRNSNTAAIDKIFCYQNFNMGIFIDIFPLDNAYKKDFHIRYEKIKKLILDNSVFMRMTNPYLTLRDQERVKNYSGDNPLETYKKIQLIASQYNNKKTKFIALHTNTVYAIEKNIYYTEDFNSAIYWDFEGYKFPIPIGYKRILNTIYNNYMRLPPINERGKWHSNIEFYPDIPFKKLLNHKD